MTRWFNTAGPNVPERHYTLPVLARLPDVHRLVEQASWFVVRAPRQSGKTTAMRGFAAELTGSGATASPTPDRTGWRSSTRIALDSGCTR